MGTLCTAHGGLCPVAEVCQARCRAAHPLLLSPVLFSGCAGQPQAVHVPADPRFEVVEDGILQTKQPLQLRGQRIRFNVSALDATGKRHSAWVTVEKHRSRQQRRSNQVKCGPRACAHHSPSVGWAVGASGCLALPWAQGQIAVPAG